MKKYKVNPFIAYPSEMPYKSLVTHLVASKTNLAGKLHICPTTVARVDKINGLFPRVLDIVVHLFLSPSDSMLLDTWFVQHAADTYTELSQL